MHTTHIIDIHTYVHTHIPLNATRNSSSFSRTSIKMLTAVSESAASSKKRTMIDSLDGSAEPIKDCAARRTSRKHRDLGGRHRFVMASRIHATKS